MALTEYAQRASIGVLTPQANTTVEPELWALAPPDTGLLNARLTSSKGTIEERLVDYTTKFADTCDQFANAPLTAIAAACTGASYLIGRDAEEEIVADISDRWGLPFITAALASVMALRHMGAKRIALLSPYPDSLNTACTPYWHAHGFKVIAKEGPALETDAFHPIYAMTGGGVLPAYERLSETDADAVLMLGTGMATLRPLLKGRERGLKPAISCNLALMWAAVQGRDWQDLQEGDLPEWLAGAHWRERLNCLFPAET